MFTRQWAAILAVSEYQKNARKDLGEDEPVGPEVTGTQTAEPAEEPVTVVENKGNKTITKEKLPVPKLPLHQEQKP